MFSFFSFFLYILTRLICCILKKKKISLLRRGLFPPVRIQRGRGHCWANVLIDLLAAYLFVQNQIFTVLSLQYVIDGIDQMFIEEEDNPDFFALSMHDSFLFGTKGICDDWCYSYGGWLPYSVLLPFQKDKVRLVVADVEMYDSRRIKRLTLNEVIQSLSDGFPVSACIYCPEEFVNYKQGFYTLPSQLELLNPLDLVKYCELHDIQMHAVIIVGCVQDASGRWWFIIRNSWGRGWGVDGHALVASDTLYAYLRPTAVRLQWIRDKYITYPTKYYAL